MDLLDDGIIIERQIRKILYHFKIFRAEHKLVIFILVLVIPDPEIQQTVIFCTIIMDRLRNDLDGHFSKNIADFPSLIGMLDGVDKGDHENISCRDKGIRKDLGGYLPHVGAQHFKIGKTYNGLCGNGNGGIGGFHHLYNIVSGVPDNDAPDQVRGQGRVGIIGLHNIVMGFSFYFIVCRLCLHGKSSYFCADLVGADKALYTVYIGIDGGA